ncbi:MAG: type II secretion system protein [Phycisphaerales bacterium]|nr:type II secretion system protein [Phycisphaerales bacterium]
MRSCGCRRAFSLLDLLVSIAVIATLMAIMAPVLSKVTEATHRVMCQSNVRQLGLCLALYAEDHNDELPGSVFSNTMLRGEFQPQEMMTLRVGGEQGDWDGLGWLFQAEYVKTPEVFYCPSHKGMHGFNQYEDDWFTWGREVLGNYHYRAFTSDRTYLQTLDPKTALISDGLRTHLDFNHRVGTNVLRADMSVEWVPDRDGTLSGLLPPAVGALEADEDVYAAWWLLERGTLDEFPGLPWDTSTPGGTPGFEAFVGFPG